MKPWWCDESFRLGMRDMATVAQRIRKVKNDIEDNNADVHRISGV